ncbi:hypothetical protein AVDCRST_MAG84-6522 [uncultured Microcoleus sp.]|uniref:Uncharacterized protein n=1 Tax=uncultured Microcoleus sp. TaxID=259945 RepID=A0A6J4P8G4_9CYAN|nr:hypothetical protein AVDCRST_MAG84-6522 [uncultured Microcoleus sp.]
MRTFLIAKIFAEDCFFFICCFFLPARSRERRKPKGAAGPSSFCYKYNQRSLKDCPIAEMLDRLLDQTYDLPRSRTFPLTV